MHTLCRPESDSKSREHSKHQWCFDDFARCWLSAALLTKRRSQLLQVVSSSASSDPDSVALSLSLSFPSTPPSSISSDELPSTCLRDPACYQSYVEPQFLTKDGEQTDLNARADANDASHSSQTCLLAVWLVSRACCLRAETVANVFEHERQKWSTGIAVGNNTMHVIVSRFIGKS